MCFNFHFYFCFPSFSFLLCVLPVYVINSSFPSLLYYSGAAWPSWEGFGFNPASYISIWSLPVAWVYGERTYSHLLPCELNDELRNKPNDQHDNLVSPLYLSQTYLEKDCSSCCSQEMYCINTEARYPSSMSYSYHHEWFILERWLMCSYLKKNKSEMS